MKNCYMQNFSVFSEDRGLLPYHLYIDMGKKQFSDSRKMRFNEDRTLENRNVVSMKSLQDKFIRHKHK